jgi:hypothetical protein
MSNQEKTNPRRMEIPDEGVAPPPRLLMWLVVGVFVLGIVGVVTGIIVFRNVLRPGQQERVMGILPFMEVFLPPHPDAGDTLPTPMPENGSGISPSDLLSTPLIAPTPEATEPVVLPSPTVAASFTPTSEATESVLNMTPTTVSTEEAAIAPTQETVANIVPPRADSMHIFGFTPVRQTWNNCGPANITMALSYYGWEDGQEVAASYLRPDTEDKNVSPSEMASFVNERTGVRAITRIGGDIDLLRDLLANEFPVIIETGYLFEGSDWLGHYQTVVGYDDLQSVFFIFDSYLGTGENGAGIAETYADLDRNWQQFNRTFIVIYRQEDESRVASILGDRSDLALAAEYALEVAQTEARANPQNGFAWFNMGTAYTRLARYDEAALAYDQARRIGLPFRMSWYQFGPFEAYYNVQRYDEVLSLANVTINDSRGYVEEAFFWQGQALAAQGENRDAASAFRQALALNPSYAAAQTALDRLNI